MLSHVCLTSFLLMCMLKRVYHSTLNPMRNLLPLHPTFSFSTQMGGSSATEYKKHLSCVRRNRIRTILWRREQEMAKNRLRLRTSSSIAWLNDIFAKKLLMYCETFVHSKSCSTSRLLIQCFYEVSPIYRFII